MKKISNNQAYDKSHEQRFRNTIAFLQGLGLKSSKILNLGPDNPLSEILISDGYDITNTSEGQDLDFNFEIVKSEEYDAVFGFEIIEHMVSPFPLLSAIAAKKLVLSVPLSLWFANAYWNEDDPYDRHFHEFEPKQLKMLLEKSGWEIIKEKKHTSNIFRFGIRPVLRMITPRYYFVYCERK